jgi:hypothetical protein
LLFSVRVRNKQPATRVDSDLDSLFLSFLPWSLNDALPAMANTWLPRHSAAPVKEGRSLLMVKSRSRRRWVVYLLLAAAAVWLVISHSAASSSVSYTTAKDRLAEFAHPKTAEAAAKDEFSQGPATLDLPPKTTNKNKDPIPALLHGSFDAALDHLFSIFPDELYRSELLRPITSTNNKRLRELGLRSQAYQRYFEAWEKLHLVTSNAKDGDNYYPLDNLIPYMRARLTVEAFPEALHKYEAYRHFLTQFSKLLFPWTSPYYPDHLSLHASIHHGGRGIVVLVGNNHAHFLLASIPTIRTLGCELPIEIMYLGDGDLRKDYRVELEALPGVTTRDLSMMVDDEGWELGGWAGKPFSILLSSFNEVILIDADSLFFVNPEAFFDDEDYVRTGALFFRDRLIFPESKREWLQEILSEPISKQVMQNRLWTGESGHMQESGIVVVDKWRHFHALLLVCTLNGRDREGNKDENIKGMYDMVYGTVFPRPSLPLQANPVATQVTKKRTGSAGNSAATPRTPFTPAQLQ